MGSRYDERAKRIVCIERQLQPIYAQIIDDSQVGVIPVGALAEYTRLEDERRALERKQNFWDNLLLR